MKQRLSPAFEKAIAATLFDKFGMTFEEMGELTDRQIHEIAFHRRTKEGMIDIPEAYLDGDGPDEPLDLEGELMKLRELTAIISPENMAECEAALRAKFSGDKASG